MQKLQRYVSAGWLAIMFVSLAAAQSSNHIPTAPANDNAGANGLKLPIAAQHETSAAAIIEAGDLLDISVFDVPELTQQVRVAGNGKVQLALLGTIAVAGLTTEGAGELIGRELRDGNFLIQPQVNVLIRESGTGGVSVVGEIQHPGIYHIEGTRTLLDIVSMAGGLTNVADTRITIKHRATGEEVVVKLSKDDARTSLAKNVPVFPGDLIVVPHAGIVYVLGEVARPGGFVMQDSGKISLLQALAEAGGTKSTASGNHALLLRKHGDEYVTNQIHLDKVTRGQEHDVELIASDVVFVPGSRLKTAAHNTGSIAAMLGSTSIYVLH